MKKVLVAGATGSVGFEVLKRLKQENYYTRVLTTSKQDVPGLQKYADEIFVGNALDPESIKDLCKNIDIIFSAMGKSVSLFTRNGISYCQLDYQGNKNILKQAAKSGVNRFVYVSIYGSRKYIKHEIALAHESFITELKNSGLSFSVISPVGVFTGLHDLLIMGLKGLTVVIGKGDKRTNPIHQKDLAYLCVKTIPAGDSFIEAGGPKLYTRSEIARIASRATNSFKIHLPKWLVKIGIKIIKFFNKNIYKKLAFFYQVTTENVIAPKFGYRTLEDYFTRKGKELEPA